MKTTEISQIRLTWIYNEEPYFYSAVRGTLLVNTRTNSLRFTLEEINGKEDPFDVVIQNRLGSYTFRMDCYGEDDFDYSLKAYKADDELLLYFADECGEGYFRLSC